MPPGSGRSRVRSVCLVLAVGLVLAACDSWAEAARNAEAGRVDSAFSTTLPSTGETPPFPDTTRSAPPSATQPLSPAVPTTPATSSTTTVTLAPARVVTVPPAPPVTTIRVVELPTTSTTIRVVELPTSTTAVSPSGWIGVLASLSTSSYSREGAAAWRVNLGLTKAELLMSSDYASLTPGYWVLYEGPFSTKAEAIAVCDRHAAVVPGCYPRQLTLVR